MSSFALPKPNTRRSRTLYGVVGTVLALLLAEVASRAGIVDSRFVPPPSVTLVELVRLLATGPFWAAVGDTMQGWATGLAISGLIAIPLGILIGSNEFVFRATRPVIEFLRPVPSVALIPLAILLFGTGMQSKVFLIVFACVWPILIQAVYGLRDVEPTQLDTARVYRISAPSRIFRIILPSSLPYLVTGFRISAATALILSVTAELIIGSPGIGQVILLAQASGAPATMYAAILSTGFLGVAINGVLVLIEKRLLRWHPSHREVSS